MSGVAIDFVTPGDWGPGIGRKLEADEADTNIWHLKQAVEALQSDRPQPNPITAITTTNASITFHFEDGSTIGPLALPVLLFRWRFNWAADTFYQTLDAFAVPNVGIFVSLVDHDSAATFDPLAVDSPVAAGLLAIGTTYRITTVGDTDFTLIGSADNVVGTEFVATGPGTGTGTASPRRYLQLIGVTENSSGLAISALPSASLPLNPAAYLIVSEPTGTTPPYASKKILASDALAQIPAFQLSEVPGINGTTFDVADVAGATEVIVMITGSGAATMTTPTAADIIAALPLWLVGASYRFRLCNPNTGTLTLAAGTGITITGLAGTAANKWREYLVRYTAAGAVEFRDIGSGDE